MVTKRGLSDIVTNVLIILLVLVAVSIIWFFIRPLIQQSAGSVAGVNDCLTMDIEPVSCSAANGIIVKRNANAGSGGGAALQQLKFVFTNPTTKTNVVGTNVTTLPELATISIPKAGIIMSTPGQTYAVGDEVTVAAVISTSQGLKTCDISSIKAVCTA